MSAVKYRCQGGNCSSTKQLCSGNDRTYTYMVVVASIVFLKLGWDVAAI